MRGAGGGGGGAEQKEAEIKRRGGEWQRRGGEIRKIDEWKHGGYLENGKRCERMKEDKTERY